jgi:hypothetical protein
MGAKLGWLLAAWYPLYATIFAAGYARQQRIYAAIGAKVQAW